MSCQLPTHSVDQSKLRKEILDGMKDEYKKLKDKLISTSQVDADTNAKIIELMNKLLDNNVKNREMLGNQNKKLKEIEKSLEYNKAYLQSLRDTIIHNEDSKLVISNKVNTMKEKSQSISKQFVVYIALIVILFLVEIGVLIFV